MSRNSIITPEIWKILLDTKPPVPNFMFQPVEYTRHIGLRIFRENFEDFSDYQRELLAIWLAGIVKKIRDLGVPCYLEAFDRPGGTAMNFETGENK